MLILLYSLKWRPPLILSILSASLSRLGVLCCNVVCLSSDTLSLCSAAGPCEGRRGQDQGWLRPAARGHAECLPHPGGMSADISPLTPDPLGSALPLPSPPYPYSVSAFSLSAVDFLLQCHTFHRLRVSNLVFVWSSPNKCVSLSRMGQYLFFPECLKGCLWFCECVCVLMCFVWLWSRLPKFHLHCPPSPSPPSPRTPTCLFTTTLSLPPQL